MLCYHNKHDSDMYYELQSFGDCPKAKKSKPSESEPTDTSCWGYLPDVILHEIFDKLGPQDRKNASTVCKHWRRNVYHRKWWPNMTFVIEPGQIDRARYLNSAFSKLVSNATVKTNALSVECVEEFMQLIHSLADNPNLKSLVIQPSHCRLEIAPIRTEPSSGECGWDQIVQKLKACLPRLQKFSIGCIEELADEIENFAKSLASKNAANVTLLGLASVKDDPGNFKSLQFEPKHISHFNSLKILSIDYDILSDTLLDQLDAAPNFERLIIHLHGVDKNPAGISNEAWANFKNKHPNSDVRLNVIHAFNDISDLHNTVLRKDMRLTHIKVFFCENVNISLLERLSVFYAETLVSLMWVDSLSETDRSYSFTKPLWEDSPDPLILLAWRCKRLKELVLHGYKYFEENLIAIARLRGPQLEKLEIAEDDIMFSNSDFSHENCRKDIPISIKKKWSPLQRCHLHPVICSPTAGDSDEYILPLVLADLH